MYQPKYDLLKVVPFVINPNEHTNLEQMHKLVEQGKLNEIAYWFNEKNKGNPRFKYAYDGGNKYDYQMYEFFENMIELSIEGGKQDILEFLLFDELVKDRHLLRGRNAEKIGIELFYSNIVLTKENKDTVLFCLKNWLFGCPMEIGYNFDFNLIKKAINEVNSEEYAREMQFCLRKLAMDSGWKEWKEGLENLYPDEFQAYQICEDYLNVVRTRKKINKSLGPLSEEQLLADLQKIEKKLESRNGNDKNTIDLKDKRKTILLNLQKLQKKSRKNIII